MAGPALLTFLVAGAVRGSTYVIPPGQEELMAAMVGRDEESLPGGCRFGGASIQQTRVTVSYACGAEGRELVLQLRHPDEGGSVRTERFALTAIVGQPPPELLAALTARIRRSESEWKWGESGDEGRAAPGGGQLGGRAVPPGSHWLLPMALLLVVAARARGGHPIPPPDIRLAAVIGVGALALRLALGPWGPLRVNGLGPLWLDGAISDPGQLYGYGPGYPEIFSVVARSAPSRPDRAIFAANGVISALIPVLTFALARLVGMDRTRAGAAAILLAVDPVAIRVATTESYMPAIITLTLAASVLIVAASSHASRREWRPVVLLALAAGFLLGQSVRIHPLAWIPATLAPLTALVAGDGVPLRQRLVHAAGAVTVTGAVIGTVSGSLVIDQFRLMQEGEVMVPSGLVFPWWFPVVAVLFGVAAFRWARPCWLIVPALLQVGALATTRHDFAQSWVWQQSYDRLYVVLPLLALLAFVRGHWPARRVSGAGFLGACVVLLVASRPLLRERTTDHLEYRWVREALVAIPPECLVLYVGQVGKRNMMLPIFGAPARPARKALRIDGNSPGDLAQRLHGSRCTFYVRSSLCSSSDARSACDRVESLLELEPMTQARFAAIPSNSGMPYDRAEVESAIYRVRRLR